MDLFAELEHVISSQSTTNPPASEILAKIGSPTVSIAILDHGSIVSKCLSTTEGDPETLFQACSITKPITGMATMRLIQAGKFNLDSTIVSLLPEHVVSILETPHTKHLLDQITVRQLMSHTSGLSVGGFPGYAGENDVPDAETVLSGKAPANTPQVRVFGLPGYSFSYSGGGMTVLQLILETATGLDFPSLMKELVLDPLEMSRSFFALPDGEKNIATAHFSGYTKCNVPWHTLPEKAAAGLWTTPTDLLKAVRGLQGSLKGGDETSFLREAIAREMLEEVQSTMALNWVAPREPGVMFTHSGSNSPGWECFVIGYADLKYSGEKKEWDDCGISIMTNSAEGYTVWTKVLHAIAYLKNWPPFPYLNGKGVYGKIPFCIYAASIDKRWAEWKGSWYDGKKVLVLESDADGKPVLRFGKGSGVRLVLAAISSIEYAGKGKSIDLVLEGLEMMIRLGWKDGKRDMELWFDGVPPTLTNLKRGD